MATFNTTSVFGYVFSKGNYQVAKFFMEIMSRLLLRMRKLLHAPVIRAPKFPPLLEASQNFLSPHKKVDKTEQRHFSLP